MQQPIVTAYSNQLHQLLVSVSKHLYFGSDGNVKYQEKPMDVNIKNCHKSRKEHLVYFSRLPKLILTSFLIKSQSCLVTNVARQLFIRPLCINLAAGDNVLI